MQTYQLILFASSVLLVAFVVERFANSQRIPSVILMIATGVLAKWAAEQYRFDIGDVDDAVSTLGSVGLVLIVLEGAMDLDASRNRWPTAAKATLSAVIGIVLCAGVFVFAGMSLFNLASYQALILATPLAVISSAVAIPSSGLLPPEERAFVVYESAMSDIFGVLLFFAIAASDGTLSDIAAGLFGGGGASLMIALVVALAMVGALSRMDGHVRFIPLLAGLFALYAIGKLLHLSPLILVLVFGLLVNNYSLWIRFRPIRRWADASFPATVVEFKGFVRELTFAARGVFFILLGYWANLSDLLAWQVWGIAAVVLVSIYGSRYLLLSALRQTLAAPLTWIAPRGLITILLYFSAKQVVTPPPFIEGAILLVVLISSSLTLLARPGPKISVLATGTSMHRID